MEERQMLAVVVAEESSTAQLAYAGDVSSSDLLHGLTPTTTGWNFSNGATPANLNDGTHGTSFDDVAGAAVATIAWTTVGATAEYNLGTGANGLGYDLTAIQSIADWNGASFGNQAYAVEVRTVGGSYAPLATIAYEPLGGAGGTKVTITEDTDGILARGVEYIRFTANSVNGGANSGAFTFREIDVEGTATTAGPATLIDEDFQDPSLGNGAGNPGFAGWVYRNGGSVKARNANNQSDVPGDRNVPNQLIQLEWTNAEAIYDVDHNWAAGKAFTLTLNASPQSWNGSSDRYIAPKIVQDNGTVLWSANTLMPKYASFGRNPWTASQTFEYVILTDNFTAGAEGESIRLEIDHSGQRGIYVDNVKLTVGDPPADSDPPTPDPLSWDVPPTVGDFGVITMSATNASDPAGVEYYFENLTRGTNSGWQDARTWTEGGLDAATEYTYRATARDKSGNDNQTAWTPSLSATTPALAPGTLLATGFQSPTYSNGSSNPGFHGWTWGNAGSVKVRKGGHDGAPESSTNQVIQFEQTNATANYDIDYNWASGEAFTLTLNATPQRWNGDKDRFLAPRLLQDDGTVLWSASSQLPKYDDFGGNTWSSEQTFEYVILTDSFTSGTPGQSVRLQIAHTGQRGIFIDNVNLSVGAPPVDNDPPTPDPSGWDVEPTSGDFGVINMAATPASDPAGVEYFFENVTTGSNSGWQSSNSWIEGDLAGATMFTYQVKTRDSHGNETQFSPQRSATTPAMPEGAIFATGFQSPMYPNNTGNPNFAGWVYERGGSVKARTSAGTSDAPGDQAIPNQLIQLEWTNATAQYDTSHNWASDEVYTVTLNASPQSWNGTQDRFIQPSLLQADGTVLWSGSEQLPHYDNFGRNPWTEEQTFTFEIPASEFTTGSEGQPLSLKIASGGFRGLYVDNVLLTANTVSTITGTAASQSVGDNDTIQPFSSVIIGDDDGDDLVVSVALDTTANGELSGGGFAETGVGTGIYTFHAVDPAAATAAIRALTFTPVENQVAPGMTTTTTFTIAVDDQRTAPVTDGTTSVISTSINDAPVTIGDNLTATEDGSPVTTGVLGSDVDVDDDAASLTYSVTNGPSEGTASSNGDGTFTFDPGSDFQDLAAGAVRTVSFDVTATDNHNADSNPSTVNVVVVGVNDAPVISQGAGPIAGTTDEDASPTDFVAPTLDATDIDGDTLSWSVLSAASNGIADVSGSGASPTTFTYTPNANFNGTDSFTVQVSDGNGGTDSITVEVTVNQVNDPAIFSGDLAGAGITIAGTLLASDPIDGMNTPNYTVVSQGALGNATIDSVSGEWTFTPTEPVVFGDDAFTVQVTDDDGNDETQVIQIEVTPVFIDGDGNLVAQGLATPDRFTLTNAGGGQALVRFNNQYFGPHSFAGKIIVHGDEGNDRISIAGNLNRDVEFYGGEGKDYLAGGIGDDILDGGNSNDIILTGEGDNTALGGNGNDRITGRSGDDTLIGQNGNDKLAGAGGNDVLIGDDLNDDLALGSDELVGGNGDDLLVGGPGNDILSGGFGDDVLVGNEGNDLIRGNADEDLLIGGEGGDTVYGESGVDRLVDGTAANENNQAELISLLAEWTGSSTGLNRPYNAAGALASDTDEDFLSGGTGVDAILFGAEDGNPVQGGDIAF